MNIESRLATPITGDGRGETVCDSIHVTCARGEMIDDGSVELNEEETK